MTLYCNKPPTRLRDQALLLSLCIVSLLAAHFLSTCYWVTIIEIRVYDVIRSHHRPLSSVDLHYNGTIWLWSWGGLSVFNGEGSVAPVKASAKKTFIASTPERSKLAVSTEPVLFSHSHTSHTEQRETVAVSGHFMCDFLPFLPCSSTVFHYTLPFEHLAGIVKKFGISWVVNQQE